jgi:hypothetical protein
MAYFPNVLTPKEYILLSSQIQRPAICSSTAVTVWPIARNVLQTCIGTTGYKHVILLLDLDAINLRRQHQYQQQRCQ